MPTTTESSGRNSAGGIAADSSVGECGAVGVVLRGPVRPGDHRGEPLAAVGAVREAGDLVAPGAGAEPLLEQRAAARSSTKKSTWCAYSSMTVAQAKRPEARSPRSSQTWPGVAWEDAVAADVDRDLLRDDAPVERARVERGAHGGALGRVTRRRTRSRRRPRCADAGRTTGCARATARSAEHLLLFVVRRRPVVHSRSGAGVRACARFGDPASPESGIPVNRAAAAWRTDR